MVGTRTNGADDLFRLGGGKNEDHVLRWFLHHLQKRVGARGGNHVRLVDNEDAIARLSRCIVRAVTQLTHVFHTVVGSRVKLSYIQIARATWCQRNTRLAHATRGRRRPLLTVERAGHNAR